MEKTEPAFIPGWLRGTGNGGSGVHSSSDDGGLTRSKVAQHQTNSSLESPRKSLFSSKAFSSTLRRSHNSNGAVDRQSSERDPFGLGRSKSSLNRSSSSRNHSKLSLEQNGYNSWIDGEYSHEVDRDYLARKKDWSSGNALDSKDKDKEFTDSSMRQILSPGYSGRYDLSLKLRRSQSVGISAPNKVSEAVSAVPSSNGSASGHLYKNVIENNFPSLGADDKQSSPQSNPISSPWPLSNQHMIWQGNSRSDLSRASSPGLAGGYTGPLSSIPPTGCGNDFWSSALADVPVSNGNVQPSTLLSTAISPVSGSQTTSFVGPVTSAAPLNMAEALAHNPPSVRVTPQSTLESQRLEELALRQSRQLIPMIPSLPKTMSLADKAKSKSSRTADVSSASLKLQLSSSQKAATPLKPDNPKASQGRLLVLKSGKDGGVVMTTTSKSEGNILPHGSGQVLSAPSAGSNALVQRKQLSERKLITLSDNSRAKDSALLIDEKRVTLNTQNRSDFFNTLRKKAAANGVSVNASNVEPKNNSLNSLEATVISEVASVDDVLEGKENGSHYDGRHSSLEITCNGEDMLSPRNNSARDALVKGNEVVMEERTTHHSHMLGDLEEEAEFMRSLGWQENEEGSELTEEEIHDFVQMEERNKLLIKSRLIGNSQIEQVVGSVGSLSSGFSSSDSETEQAPTFLFPRAIPNSLTCKQ
ncbi:hypothetical protein KP509_15G039900 [Ceratopteris richardii]|uniref:Uncharacterized protein n=1 Tax=Ceratopteris richardii TaxID=49495 RepID=A0A8T2T7E1_CERRI|nr:hypothetical protein KP509_15G039900 [Ceratopteris richardii]